MTNPGSIPYKEYARLNEAEMKKRAVEFYESVKRRRTVRDFSDEIPPLEIIELAIKSAGTAPSGANMQPWHFVVVKDPDIKKKIREGAEKEEKEFYNNRAPEEWLKALTPIGTDEHKPFLETAPYLIVIFEKKYGYDERGEQIKHYYTKESVGIAVGVLITALHQAGLAMLTHTPSSMSFLNKILNRPLNEKPFLILVAGYPAKDVLVPGIRKKSLSDIITIM